MKPIELRLTNFRSFTKQQAFTFSQRAGLNYLTGRNDLEPELEANGTGKSSLWEALCWVLFGKTSRLLKAGDIGTWSDPKNTKVELDFTQQDAEFTLIRTWNPNSLKIKPLRDSAESLKDITQDELEAMLGITFQPFLNSVFMSQFSTMFLDLGPTDKANLVAAVMDLDRWSDFSDRASKKAKDLERSIQLAQQDLSRDQGKKQALEDQNFDADIADWERRRKEDIARAESEYKDLLERQTPLKEQVKALVPPATGSAQKALTEAQSKLADARKRWQAEHTEETKLKTQLEATEKLWQFFNDATTCPTCGQPVTDKHRDRERTKLDEEAAEFEKAIAAAKDRKKKISDEEADIEAEIARHREAEREDALKAQKFRSDRDALNAQVTNIDRQLDRLEQSIESLEKQSNPFEERKAENARQLEEIIERLMVTKEDLEILEAGYSRNQYWVKGFKDLRLFLISEALTQLEIEVNSAMLQLGLVDWKIEFAVDAETKSGTVRRGFTVLITSPYNKTPVAWESWSGGESQRLRIAAQMGLSNLILNNLGLDVGVEIWDEPSSYMSGGGIQDLLESLQQRAVRLGKQIWIVDHHSLEFGGFDRMVTIVKDTKGSRIEE